MYFIPNSRLDEIYCDYPKTNGKTCREQGAIDLDIENRILLITSSDYIKQQMIALRIWGIEMNIHV